MNRWIVVGIAALAAAATVAAEWQRHPGAILAAGLGLLALTTGLAARRRWLVRRDTAARALVFGAASSALLALAAAADTWELHQLAVNWPSRREAAIAAASGHLEGELRWAAARSDALAESALPLLDSSAQAAFAGLARLLDGDGPTMAVALFDGAGRRHAWAGPHRAAIGPDGPALEAFTTGFYVWLVARRQTSAGVAVATLLLYRRAAVPQIGTALADRFAAATGVGLRLLASGEAPPGPDVFDYLSPSGDTLFAVVTVPPEQAAARNERLSAARVRSLLLA
ncbi:MAG TPA: hypothetical protein VNL98_08815, partial [Gemmatimonadales bacterium]|nr:hypothetical protein [Gemmatimonadales bacterium]